MDMCLAFSVSGGADAFKKYVLDNEGYVGTNNKPADDDTEFKIKSRRSAREINVTVSNGKTEKRPYMKCKSNSLQRNTQTKQRRNGKIL